MTVLPAPFRTAARPGRRAALALALALATSVGAAPAPAGELPDSLLAPETIEPIRAEQFTALLEHHRGRVVLINFWATWCIPCRYELPDLDLLQQRYRDRGLQVITVTIDQPEKLEAARAALAKQAPNLVGYLQAEEDEYAFIDPLDPDWVGALPTSFFVDRAGTIRKSHPGRMLYKDLEREVLALLDEAP
ncbi:MAG TPA: TlpA disulfide reductase family protein [Thermoanaerobaculia bacterium]|nr:TlpA disulfide reductase family protein [Thermoanaerobaculia bacterium]